MPETNGVSDTLESNCTMQVNTALLACLFGMIRTVTNVKSYLLFEVLSNIFPWVAELSCLFKTYSTYIVKLQWDRNGDWRIE